VASAELVNCDSAEDKIELKEKFEDWMKLSLQWKVWGHMEHFDSTRMKLDQRLLRKTIMLIFLGTLFWKFKDETELWQKKK
jgi:hypothetical protein